MRRSRTAALLGALTVSLVGSTAAHGASPGVVSEAPPRVVGAAPVFTDPLWLPVRRPAAVSCVRTNCHKHGKATHGFWAIDFLGERGDPVNAAGYGIAHIGARSTGCATGKRKRGNWVWVDHGAGEVTMYFHLDSIAIVPGQRVTPATVLGRMGSTGTCATNYLHYERRTGGVHGIRRYPAAHFACLTGRPRMYPHALGHRSWDGLPIRPRRKTVTSGGAACTTAPRPIAAPTGVRVLKRRAASVKLQWNPATPGVRYAIMLEPFRKRTREWRRPKFRATKRTTIVVRNLKTHGIHRFRLAVDGPAANSAWTAPVVVRLK